jgi:hypothetical protein
VEAKTQGHDDFDMDPGADPRFLSALCGQSAGNFWIVQTYKFSRRERTDCLVRLAFNTVYYFALSVTIDGDRSTCSDEVLKVVY